MGWETELNAVPAKCSLFERLGHAIDPDLLTFVRTYFRLRRQQDGRVNAFSGGDPAHDALVDVLEELVELHPGIETRYCDLERRPDWLGWLLVQCLEREDEKTLAVAAIKGEAKFLPLARGTQGFPIRWTNPETCARIHRWLSELTEADLRSRYNPARMCEARLYKWALPSDPDATLDRIIEDLAALKSLYHEVTTHGEGVLVVVD